jgi:hypothetical protein
MGSINPVCAYPPVESGRFRVLEDQKMEPVLTAIRRDASALSNCFLFRKAHLANRGVTTMQHLLINPLLIAPQHTKSLENWA